MKEDMVAVGDVIEKLWVVGQKVRHTLRTHQRMRHQILLNMFFLDPVPSDKQIVPPGWYMVCVPEDSIFKNARHAASFISSTVRTWNSRGHLVSASDDDIFVLIPKHAAHSVFPTLSVVS